ncbi:MAG: aminotransferase class III-fold pyridoxal phosphate-dependent enzyme, partial [Candidatus Hydrogenedentales bacterium]
HGFHGKKGLAGDVTGEQSPNPKVRWAPFARNKELPQSYFREALDRLAGECRGSIALLITEPYLGAAGSYHPPRWYHPLLQSWCREHDVPFIFDEVQSGFGRTGNMFAYQTYDVQPDLVVLGKGLANGEPCAAVIGRADLIDALDYGEASDTYSGNPRACAAVCAVLDVFEEEQVVEQARARGAELRTLLDELANEFPFITEVRGEGMVYGVECADAAAANTAVLEAYRGVGGEGVHLLGPLAEKVLRVSPPLTITPAELARAGAILRQCWARVEIPAVK